ncbi:AsmA-like C-terminal domain-containing protein [Geomonas sp. RF6]|uniref:DUF3971 domain-containing protein n=1 Tax=Geomonas sp. RF6 TaxID=2897342 RepID=UPI001E5C5D40|nr:DUF3971 domain-containing protein [Geomonas sp. RF6]UFS68689.1 AsmA-like C-terminal domain-containing protein [Geomonas sp. RF6]
MPLTRKKIAIVSLAVLAIALIAGGAVLVQRLMNLETYRGEIIDSVQQSLKREVRYEQGTFSLGLSPAFTFTNVAIREPDRSGDFVRTQRLTFKVAILPLLYKRVVLKEMVLERPVLQIIRAKDGRFNISDLLEEKPSPQPSLKVKGVQLIGATLTFTDNAVAAAPLVTSLRDTQLSLSHLDRGKSCDFKIVASLVTRGRSVPLSASGKARLASKGERFTETFVDGKIRTGGIDSVHFLPYYGRYLPFSRLGGELALDCSFKGKLNSFKSKGEVRVSRLFLEYPQVFHAPLTPKLTRLGFEMELGRDFLSFDNLKLNVDGAQGRGSCRLSDIHSGDLRITAKATTSPLNFQQYHQFIPYGVIVKDPAEFIEQKIRGGNYRLEEGRLDGRISQILHMERGRNYDVLYIRARAEDGLLVYAKNVPAFSEIKGILELSGKDFNLKGMSGKFGGSPFTLEGKITDYPIDVPSGYPFTMTMLPRQQEAAWLMGSGRGEKLALSGDSTLHLTGSGFTSLYHLNGTWDLTHAAFRLPQIEKPSGRPNTLSFSASLSPTETKISSLSCQLAPLSVQGSALYRYDKGGSLTLDLKSNPFQAAEIAPLLPDLKKYRPAGVVQGAVQGKGSGLSQLSWGGEINLNGFSLHPGGKVKVITGLSGALRFDGDTLETSHFTARLGNSQVYGKGTLVGFKKPHLELSFSAPVLDVADLGFTSPKGPLKVEKVQGTVTFREDDLQIGALSLQLGKSPLNVRGSVQDLEHPRVELAVNSPYLELEDLGLLSELSGGTGGSGRSAPLKVTVSADAGKVRDIPFKRLKGTVMLEDRILYLQPVELSAFDGDITAKARIDNGSASPRYQASFTGHRLSAEKLMHALGVQKQQVTGTAFLQGELTARGGNSADIKKTALGSVKIKVEQGTIRKFATLSKIFSILNVSQLLKFQLPDMVSGGMPYNKITGDIAIRDGVAATSNLYLDSNAINMTTVGKVDMVRDELDLTVGVQPLQTVDKIVSRIPVVGWVLTGKDRTLVTTYFEAKGKIDNPQVTAVPVKSLAKGVFNIFKRMFELPTRLISNMGQVITDR